MAFDEASTRFLDGMRVATEHMRHLQQTSVDRARQLRSVLGSGGVSHGLKTTPAETGQVSVSPGLAIDGHGRPVVLDAPATVAVPEGRHWLVAVFELRLSLLVGGVPTVLKQAAVLQTRPTPPPYDDGAVPFAEVRRQGPQLELLQKGEWYLPPLGHTHSGNFYNDRLGHWRYDGDALGNRQTHGLTPHFDSGLVPTQAGTSVTLEHGLDSQQLLVELTAQREDGTVSNRGLGSAWWYELPDAQHVTLQRAAGDAEAPPAPLWLRVRAWRSDSAGPLPLRPIADAGPDQEVAGDTSFQLDASRSRALGGRRLVHYQWTLLS